MIALIHSIIAAIEGIIVSIYGLGVFYMIVPVCQHCLSRIVVMLLPPLSFLILAFAIYSTAFVFSSAYNADLPKKTSRTLFVVHLAYEVLFIGFILSWIWLMFFKHVT